MTLNTSSAVAAPLPGALLERYLHHQPRRIRLFNSRMELIWENAPGAAGGFPVFRDEAGRPVEFPPTDEEAKAWPVRRVAEGDARADRSYWVASADASEGSTCYRLTAWAMREEGELTIVEETEAIDKRFCPEARVRQLDEELAELLTKVADHISHKSDAEGLRLRLSNPNLQHCHEIKGCGRTTCPAYEHPENLRCWEIENTYCGGGTIGRGPLEKLSYCNHCKVFLMACPDPLSRVGENLNRLLRLLQLKHEEALEAQARVQQSEKVATLGEVVLGLTHEIKTPLSVIMSRLDCLRLELDQLSLEELGEDLNVMSGHAARMRRVLDDLLKLANPQPVTLRLLDLNEVTAEAVAMVEKTMARQSVDLELSLGRMPCPVLGDAHHLQQVLLNLMLNARDAMPEGGRLAINLRRPNDARIELDISDTGIGIEPEHLERIFTPFFTTKLENGGTGLGLPLCRRVMMLHQGGIDVESTRGVGTRFRLTFPCAEGGA